MDIQTACATFLEFCRTERQLSENTLAAYQQDLREFRRYFGNTNAADVTGEALVSYAHNLAAVRHLAPATVKRRLACIRSMFSRLRRQRIISESPFVHVDLCIRIPARLPRCLSAVELRALLQEAERSDSATHVAAVLLFETGMRIGELAAIRVGDIDLEQQSIRIVGKGNRERQVFLPDQSTVAVLRAYIDKHHPERSRSARLLLNERDRPANAACLRRRVRLLGHSAGLRRAVTPHMFRHSTATILLETGVDTRFVQRLLGHRSITTTQIYTHVSDRALRSAIASANLRQAIGLGMCRRQ